MRYSVSQIADGLLLLGETSCVMRSHVVCPVPTVEVDISEIDLFLPAQLFCGEAGDTRVAAVYDGSSRFRLMAETATSKAEEGDLV